MHALLGEKVFLASGKQFGSERPGWFRIVFAHDVDYLRRGLERVLQALG
jgi:bifunctional pyridoxal-dependent enzyme with beta-cystathionase and maltose regulon repressor activities